MPGVGPFKPETIPICNAFAIPLTCLANTPLDINIHKIEAIKFALLTQGPLWTLLRITIYTDNKTSELGLIKQTLQSLANAPLQEALLLATKYNIVIQPIQIQGTTNTLVDALSRFDNNTIANLCPHQQNYSTSILQRHFTPRQTIQPTSSCPTMLYTSFGTGFLQKHMQDIAQQSSPTNTTALKLGCQRGQQQNKHSQNGLQAEQLVDL